MSTSSKPDVYYASWVEALPTLQGKNVAITGTTGNGTGFWVAVCAVRKNCNTLLLLNRSSKRSEESLQKLLSEKEKTASNTTIIAINCDLMSFDSVRKAAVEINTLCANLANKGLHVLVNNAGIMMFPDNRTKDGYDQQMQTNHLSHFLLTKLLFPSFEAALADNKEVRIAQQSSSARFGTQVLEEKYFKPVKVNSLGGNSTSACMKRYVQSKLANTVFAMKLHKELKAHGYDTEKIKSVAAEPGFALTGLADNLFTAQNEQGNGISWGFTFMKWLFSIMKNYLVQIQSAADGALPIIEAAFGDSSKVDSGDFFYPEKIRVGKPFKGISKAEKALKQPKKEQNTLSEKNQEILWKISEEAIGEAFFTSKI